MLILVGLLDISISYKVNCKHSPSLMPDDARVKNKDFARRSPLSNIIAMVSGDSGFSIVTARFLGLVRFTWSHTFSGSSMFWLRKKTLIVER